MNDVCQVRCPAGQFIIQGVCATCAFGTVFNPTLNQCTCPNGQYMNSQGFCVASPSTSCQSGFYL